MKPPLPTLNTTVVAGFELPTIVMASLTTFRELIPTTFVVPLVRVKVVAPVIASGDPGYVEAWLAQYVDAARAALDSATRLWETTVPLMGKPEPPTFA